MPDGFLKGVGLMADRDDGHLRSRRIFLAWMMALPVAGKAVAQSGIAASKTPPKAWPDEYDPTPPPARQEERNWRDEVDQPPPAKKERSWLDEVDQPPPAKKERSWLDEVDQPPSAKRERGWLDEIEQPQFKR